MTRLLCGAGVDVSFTGTNPWAAPATIAAAAGMDSSPGELFELVRVHGDLFEAQLPAIPKQGVRTTLSTGGFYLMDFSLLQMVQN